MLISGYFRVAVRGAWKKEVAVGEYESQNLLGCTAMNHRPDDGGGSTHL
jgi:hypothetical protein